MRDRRRDNQNGPSREDWEYRLHKTKKKNPIRVGLQRAQTKTNNVSKRLALSQTTGGKDEPNTVFMWKS